MYFQATAETVYDILSPTPPLTRYITEGRPTPRPRRTPQPADLREGVAKAYDTVREVRPCIITDMFISATIHFNKYII